MAVISVKWFGKSPIAFFNKETDLLDDAIKAMGTTATYTPDQDTHDYKDDVTNEVTGSGYTAGGQAIANDTLTYTAGTNVLKWDGDDLSWNPSTISALKNIVIYNSTPATDATRPLIGYGIADVAMTSDNGPMNVVWDAAGILTTTAA